MPESELVRFDVRDANHGEVPCAALLPSSRARALPVCLFLYGGGGSRESLAELRPALEAWWAAGALPHLLVATPDTGAFNFYLDDPARGMFWERFVAEPFIAELRQRFGCEGTSLGVVGMSMGGYGALKLALSRPARFAAVAAISPMLEPAFAARSVPLRNRYHYPPLVPQALLGPTRDPELFERDHPVARARQHAAELRGSQLAIYIDASGRDALHAHDGAEHLHRVLWQLDIAHEYRLRRDADHIGPDIVDRLREAFAWVGAQLAPAPAPQLTAAELAWQNWLDAPTGAAPADALPPTSPLYPRWLRAQLAGLREAAAAQDPSFARRYGRLPPE